MTNIISNSTDRLFAEEYLKNKEQAEKHFYDNKDRYANEWMMLQISDFKNPDIEFIDSEKEQNQLYLDEQRRIIYTALNNTGKNLHVMGDTVESLGREVAIDQYIEDQLIVIERLETEKFQAEEAYKRIQNDLKFLADDYSKKEDLHRQNLIQANEERQKLSTLEAPALRAASQISDFYRDPNNSKLFDPASEVRKFKDPGYGYANAAQAALDADRALVRRINDLQTVSEEHNDPLIRERIQLQANLENADYRAGQNARIAKMYQPNNQHFLAKSVEYSEQANALALKVAQLDRQLEERGLMIDFSKKEFEVSEIKPNQNMESQGLASYLRIFDSYQNQNIELNKADLRSNYSKEEVNSAKDTLVIATKEADKLKEVKSETYENIVIEKQKLNRLESARSVSLPDYAVAEKEKQHNQVSSLKSMSR